jgi:hypothetical protein
MIAFIKILLYWNQKGTGSIHPTGEDPQQLDVRFVTIYQVRYVDTCGLEFPRVQLATGRASLTFHHLVNLL